MLLIEGGISFTFFLFSFGKIIVSIPILCAAKHFSLTPPIGNTLPVNVTSPVIATLPFTFLLDNADTNAVTIVTPADGPSLGTAPSGT